MSPDSPPLRRTRSYTALSAARWLLFGLCLSACDERKEPPSLEGQTITSLTIRHTTPKLVQDRRLSRNIISQPGTLYSEEKIDDDIKNVFESGLVDDVAFAVKPGDGSLELIASVSTRPGFGPLWLVGNSGFSDQMLWKQISAPLAERLSRAMTVVYDLETDEPIIHRDEKLVSEVLPAVCDELERFYRSKGFPDVKVSTRSWEKKAPTDSDFLFVVEENSSGN